VKDSSKEEEDTEVVKDSSKEEEDTEVVKDSSKEEEDTEVVKDSGKEEEEDTEVVKDSSKEEEDTEVVKDSGKEEEEDTEVVKDSGKEEEDTEVVKDSGKEEEDTEVVKDSSKEEEDTEVVKDSSKEEEDTEVVKDSSKEEEDTEVLLESVKDSSKEEEENTDFEYNSVKDSEVLLESGKDSGKEEDTDFVLESVKDGEKKEYSEFTLDSESVKEEEENTDFEYGSVKDSEVLLESGKDSGKEINELRNKLDKFNKIDMDTIKNIHTPIPEMKLLTDHHQEMEFCSMKKLVDLSKPDNLDKCKIEYFIHNNIDSLDIDRGYIPYLNTRHAKISEHVNEYSVIKSFMEIPSHQPLLKGKKIQICQISTDQLTPHIKEMVEFLSAITGMDIQVINPMKLQIQRNTPVLMYNNVRFNIEIEEFENGYSLLKNDIEDIMNKSLIDRNNTVKSLIFISSHLFHVSNEISNKKYRFISTANEFDRINKIIFNTCMKILVKILLSMDIKHCSVYQCIMNKKDTIDAICPLCRYSIYKKTKVTPMHIAKRVNNLHIKNMGLIAMCKKYNKGFKL
jgi:hypothetical protein